MSSGNFDADPSDPAQLGAIHIGGGFDREQSDFYNLFRQASYGLFDYASLADFLKAAKEHFDFVPQRPKSEAEFKRAYLNLWSDEAAEGWSVVAKELWEASRL